MKIHLINQSYLEEKQGFSLKRVAKTGAFILAALIAGNTVISAFTSPIPEKSSVLIPVILTLPSDSINTMNIIINNHHCSDSFFQEVCAQLKEDGLSFEMTEGNQNIDFDNHVVITLDQEYNSGSNNIIFSPFDNTRLGDSDSLALSMKAGLEECGLEEGEIISGRVGYRVAEDGSVQHQVPSSTEDSINPNNDTSFVTISLGTECCDPVAVAKGIESGLARQKYYLDHYDSRTDLIYRADSGESVQVVADYFGSSVHDLIETNGLRDLDTLEAQTIINPNASSIPTFDSNSQFLVEYGFHKTA